MVTKTKHNYKLGITPKNEIINLLKKKVSHKEIIEIIRTKYNIEISQSLLSQMNQKLFFLELASYNKQVEAKLRSKIKVDAHLLHIVENGYEILQKYLAEKKKNSISTKEAYLIGNIVNQAHKIYMDLNKDIDNKQTVGYNVKKALGLDDIG